MAKYLEDIVGQELKDKNINKISKISREFLEDTYVSALVNNPAVTMAGFYLGIDKLLTNKHIQDFITNNFSEAYARSLLSSSTLLFSVYSTYIGLGLAKEYFLEERSIKPKKEIYEWFLDNPKIVALIGALSVGFLGNYAEVSLFKEYFNVTNYNNLGAAQQIEIFNRTLGFAITGGIVTESTSRGLKNLKRIKESVKKLKPCLTERIYNYLFEHPFIIGTTATALFFPVLYKVEYSANQLITGNLLEDTTHHTTKMLSLGATSALVGSVAMASSLIAGSLLHSHSIREIYYRSAKIVNSFLGKKQRAIEYQNKSINLPNSIERKIEDTVTLGNLYYKEGDRDKAFKHYRKAMRLFSKKSEQISYSDFFRKTFKLNTIRQSFKKLYHRKDSEEDIINKMFIDLLNKDKSSLDSLKELMDNNKEKTELKYIYGKALEISGYKESGRIQKELAIRNILYSGIKLDERPGSKNKLYGFSGILNEEVILKANSLENILLERKATERARELVKDLEYRDVPVPVGIVEHNGKALYIMEFASGDLLANRIRKIESTQDEDEKEKKRNELRYITKETADFMGLIHASFKPEGEERDSMKVINERLTSLGLKSETLDKIINNLDQVFGTIYNIKKVVNKDAHSRNWIIDEFGGIVAIDFEADRVVPITYDIANLLDQHGRMPIYEKDELFDKCLESFIKYGGKIDNYNKDQYKLAYLNSVIIRTLEAYSMLRESDKDIMLDSIENSIKAIERIKTEYNEYYRLNEIKYNNLSEGIRELKIFNEN